MFSRLIFSTIFMHSVIVSAAMLDFDPTWFLTDDTLLSNTELPSGPGSISFSQPLSPADPSLSLFDPAQLPENSVFLSTNNDIETFDALLWDMDKGIPTLSGTDNNDESNLFSDDSFQLVDCSASESPPMLGRSRLRRGDDGKCAKPSTLPPLKSESSAVNLPLNRIRQLFSNPDWQEMAIQWSISNNRDHNQNCDIFTLGQMPWGVCASGEVIDQVRMTEAGVFADFKLITMWQLTRVTPGTFFNNFMNPSRFTALLMTNVFYLFSQRRARCWFANHHHSSSFAVRNTIHS